MPIPPTRRKTPKASREKEQEEKKGKKKSDGTANFGGFAFGGVRLRRGLCKPFREHAP